MRRHRTQPIGIPRLRLCRRFRGAPPAICQRREDSLTILAALGGLMNRTRTQPSAPARGTPSLSKDLVLGFHGVRYQVKDVRRSVEFYTKHLGFKLGHEQLPAFADVSIENLTILLSGPGASGSRPMPDGRRQEPGGWNRIVLRVGALPERIEALKGAG